MYDLKVKDGGTVFLGNTEEKVYDSDIIIRKVNENVKTANKKDSHMTVFLWRHHPDLNWG